ncbi:MAG: hypothetical protein BalsKO_10000 [Balneolaceae bacterium]
MIAFLAVAGLIGSLTHYHSEGLECLEHAEEQHFVQNEMFCPVCTVLVFSDFNSTLSSEADLPEEKYYSSFINDIFEGNISYSKFGRAPPFMA